MNLSFVLVESKTSSSVIMNYQVDGLHFAPGSSCSPRWPFSVCWLALRFEKGATGDFKQMVKAFQSALECAVIGDRTDGTVHLYQ
jgi:hypothetical protein